MIVRGIFDGHEGHLRPSQDSRRQMDVFKVLQKIILTIPRINEYHPNILEHLRQSPRSDNLLQIAENHTKLDEDFRTFLEVSRIFSKMLEGIADMRHTEA